MTDPICVAERSVCAYRIVRLDPATCAPLSGPTDGAVGVAVMTANYTQDVIAGVAFDPVDGCGQLVYSAQQRDIIKGGTLTFEVGKEDFEARELLTGGELLVGAVSGPFDGVTIGASDPGPGTSAPSPVMIEIWTQTAYGTSQCSDDGLPGWFRHVFPYNLVRPADRTFDNSPANQAYTSIVKANPSWTDVWGDWPAENFDVHSAHQKVLDPAGPPAAVCGYVTPSGS